jgi:hypothetical protein
MLRNVVVVTLALVLAVPGAATAARSCRGAPSPKTLLHDAGVIESVLVARDGRLLYTDLVANRLMVLARRGARPRPGCSQAASSPRAGSRRTRGGGSTSASATRWPTGSTPSGVAPGSTASTRGRAASACGRGDWRWPTASRGCPTGPCSPPTTSRRASTASLPSGASSAAGRRSARPTGSPWVPARATSTSTSPSGRRGSCASICATRAGSPSTPHPRPGTRGRSSTASPSTVAARSSPRRGGPGRSGGSTAGAGSARSRGLVRPSSTAVGHGARGFSRANVYVGTHGGTLEELRDVAAR